MSTRTNKRGKKRIKEMHFIDTCVFLESLIKKKSYQKADCERYLTRINKIYRGVISIPVLGEYMETALEKEYTDSLDVFEFLFEFVKTAKVRIISVKSSTLEIFHEIENIDSKIEFMDGLHLACAIENNIKTFVTIDHDLLGNQKIEEEFKIKIRHPKELF
ncbi:MAG: hypothetical protein COY38_01875 [Candidatus Aenigmarchaeota archaeon CG_4_10_14_0_8_um_filter_37_24]|nr:type II toxin-antitoxin system VapC family toxin [Candidatus Aenigmarchaeota archaeon]OIN87796.1 MAG: hypothetical protein AUJ50_02450 [Candidatus Aenigmarchaeota archaeon CG1_02_38_14]PIV69368.1 MAG: hypothetical protein COS07_01010 [Candidatus Aenigmarchaeota archaeon CG01_land_8_20_14_3_00_37_9]PIW41424.1 MAG: hypothetical protein COW21_01985 [Candidatus Aenigmarchaeota archaeon CG15_BIG_FIL_POST_REV_8_21_14_020_37_27]PIY36334.1 MAG: hypothetical protein COZ04_00680 [Candidatus Aenigmarch